jgi:hypothetical protein
MKVRNQLHAPAAITAAEEDCGTHLTGWVSLKVLGCGDEKKNSSRQPSSP